jgi:hypothetical protein
MAIDMTNNRVPAAEADGEFAVVDVKDISASTQKLNERFGIGSGKLRVVDDPIYRTVPLSALGEK